MIVAEFIEMLVSNWWGILSIVLVCCLIWLLLSFLFYRVLFKRFYDILVSGLAILVLSPVFTVLMIVGRIQMKGNPFFTQERPGKKEKIFKLVKFRTMTNGKDQNGNLLPDEIRLTKYGKFLRSTSLDELPELFNIFIGQMSIVGPRPLLTKYLPMYSDEQRKRHTVRPGLTGLAQVSGRNALTWQQKFAKDIEYIEHISFWKDLKIILKTVIIVIRHSNISHEGNVTMEEFLGNGDLK